MQKQYFHLVVQHKGNNFVQSQLIVIIGIFLLLYPLGSQKVTFGNKDFWFAQRLFLHHLALSIK